MRADLSTTCAKRDLVIDIRVIKGLLTAFATALEQLAVHVERMRACLLVQIVDVLRAEKEASARACSRAASARCPGLGWATAATVLRME